MYIYIVTVAHLFIILILPLYSIKTHFSLFFSLSSHWATPTPLRSQLFSPCFIPELRSQKIPLVFLFPYLISPCIHKFPNRSQENKLRSQKLRSRRIPSRADGVRGRDSEARMECMAAVVVRRWWCCEASILLRFVGCWFFFLVDCGCGLVGFDLDWLVFFFWFIGGFWWSCHRLGGWWFGLTRFRVRWVMNGFRIEWAWDWVGWFSLMMLVG